MSNSGKYLEALVSQIERTLIEKNFDPGSFEIQLNEKIFDDEGIQIAEFDIVIRTRIGSANFLWLIECRDRPSQGPAPTAWIEQLIGRRQSFSFNKIIAVSTTGFSKGAVQLAKDSGIELRTVTALTAEDISNWFGLNNFFVNQLKMILKTVKLFVAPDETQKMKEAVNEKLNKCKISTEPILKNIKSGELLSFLDVFSYFVEKENLLSGIKPELGLEEKHIRFRYLNNDGSLIFPTDLREVLFTEIHFMGSILIHKEIRPIERISQYTYNDTHESIAQNVVFKFGSGGIELGL